MQRAESRAFVERNFSGSLPGFLNAFVGGRGLSAEEADELRRMIADLEEKIMTDLFLRVVELSWQAGVLALAVMLARLALRRAPKWAVCMLWALVAVRLIVPVSLQSRVSLQAEQSPVTAVLEQLPQTQETADAILPSGGEVLTPVQPVGSVTSAEPVQAAAL